MATPWYGFIGNSRRRNKLEKLMYEIALDLRIERGLTNDEIRQNFEISIEDAIDLMDFQDPETSLNDN
jgi:hypothetical protein